MARWWEAPKLWRSEHEVGERKVGFLDLFYDLIFVVAIAQIAHGLAKHADPQGALTFVMLILPVMWAWLGHTFYCDRFENRELSHIGYTFLAMLPVVGMAVFAHGGLDETAVGFVLSYVAARFLLVLMYVRAGIHNAAGRQVWFGLAGGFGVGAIIWAMSLLVEGPSRIMIQLIGLTIDLAVPLLLAPSMAKLPGFAEGRLRERFGLIMIIVLGESIAGTANGLAAIHHITFRHLLTGVLGLIFAFGVYFSYYEMVPRLKLKSGMRSTFLRTYLHFPLVVFVTATGAGVLATVGHEAEVLAANIRILLGLSVGLAYVTLIGLSRVHTYPDSGAGRKGTEGSLWVAFVLTIAVVIFGETWNSLQVLGCLAVISLLPPGTGIYHWRRLTKKLPMQPEDPTQG